MKISPSNTATLVEPVLRPLLGLIKVLLPIASKLQAAVTLPWEPTPPILN